MKEEFGPRDSLVAVRIAAIVLCHLALLWFATRATPMAAERDERIWVQLMMPQQVQAIAIRSQPPAPPKPKAGAVRQTEVPPTTASAPVAQAEPQVEEAAQVVGEPAESRALPTELRQQAIESVAAIDRQLRAERPQDFKMVPDASSQRLAKGFAAARAAVKPKWFEAAQTELISAPNDPRKVYRVTTAMGEYCLYYPDKGGISANSDPRSGRSEFGQPRASTCPIPF